METLLEDGACFRVIDAPFTVHGQVPEPASPRTARISLAGLARRGACAADGNPSATGLTRISVLPASSRYLMSRRSHQAIMNRLSPCSR